MNVCTSEKFGGKMLHSARVEVRYYNNKISFFRIELTDDPILVHCVVASGMANHTIQSGFDTFGIANVLRTMKHKEQREENVRINRAEFLLAQWRANAIKLGLLSQIELDFDMERGEVSTRTMEV